MNRVRGRWVAALVGVVILLACWLGVVDRAAADSYDRFDVSYVVSSDRVVSVTETVTLRFGAGSGRHGYDRLLVIREPYDEERDALYDVSNIVVTSPDPVSTQVQTSRYSPNDRVSILRIRIGDANSTIAQDAVTYVLSYDIRGALRTANGVPEFYWDVTGSEMDPISTASVRVHVPGGARDARCYAGRPPATSGSREASTTPCSSVTVDAGEARFTQNGLATGELMTISVAIEPSAVTSAAPILTERGDAADIRTTRVLQGAGFASALLIPLLGWWYYRRNGHDQRYAGVPPGTVPPGGVNPVIVRNDPDVAVPVQFGPPELPLTHAGFLLDGRYRTEHLTATLVGLATSGALQLTSQGRTTAVLRDPAKTPDEPSEVLLGQLFDRGQDAVDIGRAGQLADASDRLADDARRVALDNGWFQRLRRGRKSGLLAGLLWLFLAGVYVFDLRHLAALGWLLVPATLSLVVTLLVVRARMARGQRTALGRAWTDRIEGFRTYIATAEADQLRFEEGEDIFSKYLPWAVLFGLAERWVAVCQQAVALGRLGRPDTSWYGGTFWDGPVILWNLDALGSSVGPATAPSVAASGPRFSDDIGHGGGSAFSGGGGFAGGGGGGGGGGSW